MRIVPAPSTFQVEAAYHCCERRALQQILSMLRPDGRLHTCRVSSFATVLASRSGEAATEIASKGQNSKRLQIDGKKLPMQQFKNGMRGRVAPQREAVREAVVALVVSSFARAKARFEVLLATLGCFR